MTVASMDNYFVSKFMDMFVPMIQKKKLSVGLIELIEDSGIDTSKAISLFGNERPMRVVKNMVGKKLDLYTAQKMSSINDLYFKYGLVNFCQNGEKKSGKKTLLRTVESVVKHRHMIVHNGDLDQYNRINPIKNTLSEVKKLNSIYVFVHTADDILENIVNNLRTSPSGRSVRRKKKV